MYYAFVRNKYNSWKLEQNLLAVLEDSPGNWFQNHKAANLFCNCSSKKRGTIGICANKKLLKKQKPLQVKLML